MSGLRAGVGRGLVWLWLVNTGCFGCLGCLAGFGGAAAVAAERRTGGGDLQPNFIFILTDDQRFDSLGCAGNRLIQTPNIDRLARNGVRFENHFVTTAICAVSRNATREVMPS